MKILILPRYEPQGASSRYRFYQYIPYLNAQGWDVTVKPLLSNNYIRSLYDKTPLPVSEIIQGYIKRIIQILNKNNFDLIWLQQELFPWIPSVFENILVRGNIKIVADYDDAFFHRYDQNNSFFIRNLLKNKIDSVMEYADMVLAGNNYLLERAKLTNRNVKLFPTVVDINKFKNSNPIKDDVFTIGWIGSPGTANYLKIIEDALKEVSLDKDIRINLIGANKIKINSVSINYIKWDENTEVEEISKFDVGIMPLPDNSWERGKCGFKLIQYLSCNLPVIGSPVGVNREIIINGVNGFQANSTDEWIKYIRLLKDDKELMLKMGKNGRRFVEEKYSLQRNVVKLIDYFNELLRV
ncbi:MAG: glycosyltransferase family 4 protein [Bacteroidetes bacterium]|nr:glycosyltransferase family 4 protein [Bacteroidota bacterium]MCH8941345.1 glycosyltransferase family 4 protein [Bacteroidota bacterium]